MSISFFWLHTMACPERVVTKCWYLLSFCVPSGEKEKSVVDTVGSLKTTLSNLRAYVTIIILLNLCTLLEILC